MQLEAGLLWPGVVLLLGVLLGAAVGLCVSCARPGVKTSEKIYEQRSLQETQQSFSVARTYSRTLGDTVCDGAVRKDKLLRFSSSREDSETPRYQNFSKGSRLGSEAAYVEPITSDYYNWEFSHNPPGGEEDTNSYENVLICSQSPESGDEDYQNSLCVQQWRKSRRVLDEDGDPDYVNGDVEADKA